MFFDANPMIISVYEEKSTAPEFHYMRKNDIKIEHNWKNAGKGDIISEI